MHLRMKKGVRQLKENANLMKAFRLANYASFAANTRKTKRDKDNNLLEIPNPEDLTTRSNRKWRPFQPAFINELKWPSIRPI